MIEEKTWEEFRKIGLLWWINMILHTFGWAIVYEFGDDGNISRVYPARVEFRGFAREINTKGYENVTTYLLDNIDELCDEVIDNKE
jgi:hypothetical protein